MSHKLRYPLMAIFVVLLAGASFALGVYQERGHSGRAADYSLAFVQADLGLTHLHQYRELEAYLSRGCTNEALAKLRAHVDTQTHVLASLHKEKPVTVGDILKRRDPELLQQLPGFKSKYANGWTELPCAK